MRDEGGGGGPEMWKISVTSFMDGPLFCAPGLVNFVLAVAYLLSMSMYKKELQTEKYEVMGGSV